MLSGFNETSPQKQIRSLKSFLQSNLEDYIILSAEVSFKNMVERTTLPLVGALCQPRENSNSLIGFGEQ